MHEESKIAEAEYFLNGIAGAAEDPNATRYQASVGAAVLTFQSTLAATIIRGATGEQEHRVLKDQVSSSAPPVPVSLQADGNRSYAYEFKDWPGSGDLLTLCRRYLDEIKRIVDDGRALGFLTP